MPEGPEVHNVYRILKSAQRNHFQQISIVEKPGFKHKYVRNGIPGIEQFNNGFLIEYVDVKGKLIVIYIYNGKSHAILNTLGMTGTWLLDGSKHHHARINLKSHTAQHDYTFVDQRSFGTFKIVTKTEAQLKLRKIGHDLTMSPMIPYDWAALREGPLKEKPIGVALMEQKHFSGIGNIYKAEILYKCGINPRRLIGDLKAKKWLKVNQVAHQIMHDSYLKGGSTVRSFAANGKIGSYQRDLKVYKKTKCPKGHYVNYITQKNRTTWFCEKCQIY